MGESTRIAGVVSRAGVPTDRAYVTVRDPGARLSGSRMSAALPVRAARSSPGRPEAQAILGTSTRGTDSDP